MHRPTRAALLAALSLLLSAGFARAAELRSAALPAFPPPAEIPQLLPPELFEGFEPIPPDPFGLSPSFQYFVFQDDSGLHVLRLLDGAEVFFEERLLDPVEVGFDPGDHRLFVLTRAASSLRLRFVDLVTGRVLLDERFLEEPEIRTNLDGSVNLVVLRARNTARLLIFDFFGEIVGRRLAGPLVRWGLHREEPVVAVLDPEPAAATRIELFDLVRGLVVFRHRAEGTPVLAGFEPFGFAFVVAEPAGRGAFRVRMVDVRTGRRLLGRLFHGPQRVGFVPASRLLGVVGDGVPPRLFLFDTRNGRPVFLRR